jgi:hypothetical protein
MKYNSTHLNQKVISAHFGEGIITAFDLLFPDKQERAFPLEVKLKQALPTTLRKVFAA